MATTAERLISSKEFYHLQNIRRDVLKGVNDVIAAGENPLRTHNLGWKKYLEACDKEGIPPWGMEFCLGDVDALSFGKEPGYEDLPAELGITPGPTRDKIQEHQQAIEDLYLANGKSLTRYGPFEGINEAREAFSSYLAYVGIDIPLRGTFFSSEGSSGAAARAIPAIRLWQERKHLASGFLTAVPTYPPILDMANRCGMKVTTIFTDERDNFFLMPEKAHRIIKEERIGTVYIMPIANPTSTTIPSEQMKEAVAEMHRANPNIIFLVDLAYINSLDQKTATELLQCFNQGGRLNNSVFLTTLSKGHARPGDRYGALHTSNRELDPFLRKIYEQGNPSSPGHAGARLAAILNCVGPEVISKTSQVYQLRRQALIRALKAINDLKGEEIFGKLDEQETGAGMYVYPSISCTAEELFIKYGLFSIAGQHFGEHSGSKRARFAIGAKTTATIEQIPNLFRIPH